MNSKNKDSLNHLTECAQAEEVKIGMSCRGTMDTPVGRLCIEVEDGFITGVYIVDSQPQEDVMAQQKNESSNGQCKEKCAMVLAEAKMQLQEYFDGRRKEFNLPLRFKGTEFQKKVWQGLCTIPYGETRSYKELAEIIGNPKAVRAVGGANNKNRILIIVPCHRVIGADGSLVGFGCGLHVKKYLLELEGSSFREK